MSDSRIPFNKPGLAGNEFRYIAEALETGHISGDGTFTNKCHGFFQQMFGIDKALLTTSCTHALEMAAICLDITPGDEVIVPSFTFVSTVNAFVLRGAKPVFIDIRSDTLNMDENLLEGLITPKTRAILPVHYAGVGCEMDVIMQTAERHGIPVVEDNAHGLFGKYKGRYLGTFGCMATQSFHETKNFTCGEGGALFVNDPTIVERAEIIREKGTNRSRFFRGQVDKYTWVDIGSSYLPSDVLAAFLFAQLEAWEDIQAKRGRAWSFYWTHLQEWAADNGVRLPYIPSYCEQPFHMFYIIMPSLDDRQALIDFLKSKGILAVFHYLPLHISDMGLKLGGNNEHCPITEELSGRLLRLPFYTDITEDDQASVVQAVREFSRFTHKKTRS